MGLKALQACMAKDPALFFFARLPWRLEVPSCHTAGSHLLKQTLFVKPATDLIAQAQAALPKLSMMALALHACLADVALAQVPMDAEPVADLRISVGLATPPAPRPPEAMQASSWPALLNLASQRAAANRAADATVQAAQAQQQQAFASAWMPRADAAASSTRQKQKASTDALQSTASGPISTMSLSASLPVWRAADRAAVKVQDALADQALWQAKTQRATTARELSLAYVAAAEAGEQRRILEAQLELLQTQLHTNQRRLQGGLGTVLDELETRTRVDQVRASIQELAAQAASQRLALERLSGQPVRLPAGFKLQAAMQADLLPSLDEALKLAERQNPQWQDSQAELQAARATTSARNAEAWQPTVDAVASASRQYQRSLIDSTDGSGTTRSGTTTQSVSVQLNWPLFTGGYQQGRTKEAAALLTRSEARLDDTVAAVQTSLRDAYQNLAQAQAIITAQQSVEATATATFDAIRKAFVAGKRTNIDLLNAQAQIYAARQNLVSARVAALSAQHNILYLLDQLDADHVAPLAVQFDTAALQATHTP